MYEDDDEILKGIKEIETTDVILKLRKDIAESAKLMSQKEARYLVDLYYMVQKYRMASAGQVRSMDVEPCDTLKFLSSQTGTLEGICRKALDIWTQDHLVSQWARSIFGMGPVLAAGLRAHFSIEHCPTVGHFWRFGGYDPTRTWLGREGIKEIVKAARDAEPSDWAAFLFICRAQAIRPLHLLAALEVLPAEPPVDRKFKQRIIAAGGVDNDNLLHADNYIRKAFPTVTQEEVTALYAELYPQVAFDWVAITKRLSRRPWNASLKVIFWKIGESFVKVSSNPKDYYGKVYLTRKAWETNKSTAGDYSDQAGVHAKRVGKSTEAYKSYKEGRLPAGHLHARAKRYAVKLFLSNYQEVAYFVHYKKLPPAPYAIAQLGHAHHIRVPNAEMIPGLLEAQAKQGPRV